MVCGELAAYLARSIQYDSWKSTKMMCLHLNVTLITHFALSFQEELRRLHRLFYQMAPHLGEKVLDQSGLANTIPEYSTPSEKPSAL